MKAVQPAVYLVARSKTDLREMNQYLQDVGGDDWMHSGDRARLSPEDLIEFAGRLCYRSWKPGLNANVRKIRADQGAYLENILSSGHGSVLEHVTFSFVFQNVSRVFTHELVRHRAGTAISQESLRFVRLTEIPFWMPEWAWADDELTDRVTELLEQMEDFQAWAADHFGLDDEGVKFAEKKAKTSFMRRLAPEGVATSVMWTVNIRELRHAIEMRTAEAAEEEMRLVFGNVAKLALTEAPLLFADFTHKDGSWVPQWHKV